MSSSENHSPLPDASKIEDTLRAIVARLYRAGHHSELTVKRVRKAAEVELELPDDYLREDAEWKSKSKAIIADEHGNQENEEPISSPAKLVKASKPASKRKASPKSKTAVEAVKRGTKHAASETETKAQKKRKVAPESEDRAEESSIGSRVSNASEGESSEEHFTTQKAPLRSRAKRATKKGPAAKATRKPQSKFKRAVDSEEGNEDSSDSRSAERAFKKVVETNEDEDASPNPNNKQGVGSDVKTEEPATEAPVTKEDASEGEMSVLIDEEPSSKKRQKKKSAQETAQADASESEMSVLIDEEPPPKKQRQKKGPSSRATKPTKPKAESKGKASARAKSELSPQEAQIKELQANLVKCGIRKMWHNELKNCDTAKDKIAHLKGMLKDAGMGGRFSESKAKEIKERREMEKDIESAQDFASKFGVQEDKGRLRMGKKDWGIDETLLGGGEDSDSD